MFFIVILFLCVYNNFMKKNLSFSRKEKIASKTQIMVAEIFRDDFMDDPIISGVSLVGADSAGGLNFVKLFYHSRNPDLKLVQKRLIDVTKMVRFKLAAKMEQKYVPDLKFAYDDTLERANRIDELLAQIKVD